MGEIADLLDEWTDTAWPPLDVDVRLFVESALAHVGRVLNARRLAERAADAESLDVPSLRSAVDLLSDAIVNAPDLDVSQTFRLTAAEQEVRLRRAFDLVDEGARKSSHLETRLRLEWSLASEFEHGLLLIAADGGPAKPLIELVQAKLLEVREPDVRDLWTRLCAEFTAQRPLGSPMLDDRTILGENFFSPATVDAMRDSIARYVVSLRPRLLLRMFKQGIDSYPMSAASVPLILAGRYVTPLSVNEKLVLQALLRTYQLCEPNLVETYQAALDLPPDHWMQREATTRNRAGRHQAPHGIHSKYTRKLLLTIRRLLHQASRVAPTRSQIERYLLAYKLSREVQLPEIRRVWIKKREVALQRDLCQFLVEREVSAFGKSFGSAQIDLVAELPGERFLIEAKMFRGAVSRQAIQRAITQVLSYMDQQPAGVRGVLLLYNFSATVIVTDDAWLRSRLWVLPVNLLEATPSSRDTRIEINQNRETGALVVVAIPAARSGQRRSQR